MFLNVTDYHGNQIAIDPKRVVKLRAASLSDEPVDTVFVDYASNGTFVQGMLADISRLFGTYVKLAAFHAPDGQDIFVNKDGCGIRGKAATDSDGTRPPIPIESGHPIRTKAATLLMG